MIQSFTNSPICRHCLPNLTPGHFSPPMPNVTPPSPAFSSQFVQFPLIAQLHLDYSRSILSPH